MIDLSVSVYCDLEVAHMDLNRNALDDMMQGPRFNNLFHHMAVTKMLARHAMQLFQG